VINRDITFTHAKDSKVLKNHGKSSISNIILLSAMSLTAEHGLENGDFFTKYATDDEGLKDLIIQAEEFVDSVQVSIQALSIIMTTTDEQEYGDELRSLHWLVCGLSELGKHINYEQQWLDKGIPSINKKTD
jgi:hypothetical protein